MNSGTKSLLFLLDLTDNNKVAASLHQRRTLIKVESERLDDVRVRRLL